MTEDRKKNVDECNKIFSKVRNTRPQFEICRRDIGRANYSIRISKKGKYVYNKIERRNPDEKNSVEGEKRYMDRLISIGNKLVEEYKKKNNKVVITYENSDNEYDGDDEKESDDENKDDEKDNKLNLLQSSLDLIIEQMNDLKKKK